MSQNSLYKKEAARMEKEAQKRSVLSDGEEECRFCHIAKSKAEAYVVFEDSSTIAFLDINPLFAGHTLLVPKSHYATFTETPQEVIGTLFNNARLISVAIEKGLGADGSFIALNNKVSQSVPHLHVHIIPRKFGDGFRGAFWPRYAYKDKEEILQVQKKIRESLPG